MVSAMWSTTVVSFVLASPRFRATPTSSTPTVVDRRPALEAEQRGQAAKVHRPGGQLEPPGLQLLERILDCLDLPQEDRRGIEDDREADARELGGGEGSPTAAFPPL